MSEIVPKEEVPCNLCGSIEVDVVFPALSDHYDKPLEEVYSAARGEICLDQIVKCKICGLVYISPRPSEKTIIESVSSGSDEVYVSQNQGRVITFADCLRYVEKFSPRKGKLLDVGCAGGFFLSVAKKNGWEAHGVEPNHWLADYARHEFGVDVSTGTISQASYPDNQFDVVAMWDVLEHTPDPLKNLLETNRILKADGRVVICIPDYGSILARMTGRKWWFLLSHHLYYFTFDTLKALLSEAGFEIIGHRKHIQRVSLEHLFHMTQLYSKLFHRMTMPIVRFLRFDRLIVPYYAAQLRVVARKK